MENVVSILFFISLLVVLLLALYFLTLGAVGLFAPAKAKSFLLGFAGSAAKHYAELIIRLIAGASIVLQAPNFLYPRVFSLFGWMIVATTLCLLFIPWKWHRRFAEKAVPIALGYLPIISIASLVLGFVILACILQTRIQNY